MSVDQYSQTMASAWDRCHKFNEQYPVGTKVRYRSVLNQQTPHDIPETKTSSAAWALPNGEAVVMVKGKAGGVSLDHVEII